MSGVWVFKDGVVRRQEQPGGSGAGRRRKVLVHVPTNEVMTSHEMLARKLTELGWERYPSIPDMIQFHKRSTVHLISLPSDFSRLTSVHMYDIVVKTRNVFEVTLYVSLIVIIVCTFLRRPPWQHLVESSS